MAEVMTSVDVRRELLLELELKTDGRIPASVCNSGVSTGEHDISRMFDPFFTPKASGMRVSISRSIIVAHNEHITAALDDAGSLTLQFELPGRQRAQR